MSDDVLLYKAIKLKVIDLLDGTFALATGLSSEATVGDPIPAIGLVIGGYDENGNFKPVEIDKARGLVTIDQAHHESHEGQHYYIENFTTLDSGEALDFAVSVPALGPVPHVAFEVSATNILTVEKFEGAEISGGDAVTPINNDRNSTNESDLTIVLNPSVSVAGNDIGRQKWASRSPGGLTREDELELKMNTVTRYVLTSGANGNVVNYYGKWYEEH